MSPPRTWPRPGFDEIVPAARVGSELPRFVPSISLPQAIATVTRAPAEATGLSDRGVIEPGRRADLVRVRLAEGGPVVRAVWRAGERVA